MSTRAQELENIKEKINTLYETGEYYVKVSPDEFSSQDGDGYWGKIIDPDGKERNRLDEKHLYVDDVKYIIDYINSIKRAGNILDIGCGLGWLLSEVDSSWNKFGLEPEKNAADISAKVATIQNCIIEEADYKDDFFDIIVMHHTIEHMQDPRSVIKNVNKMLKKGGILIMATPDFDSACARRYEKNYRLLFDATHISLFSNDSMHRFLRDSDFKIESVEYPYFESRFFTKDNLLKILDKDTVSPAFYGNFMTFFCKKI